MNEISPKVKTGTVGELLVQLRLLELGVQAAPPLTDSGNDLIAIRGDVIRAIQVKTRTGDAYSIKGLPERFHLLAVVHLVREGSDILLDNSKIYLIQKKEVKGGKRKFSELDEYLLNQGRINELFR